VDSVLLTERELDVMNVLWDTGSATVSEVLGGLPEDLAYNTVLTILRRLEEKGHVRHEAEGKAHRYVSLVRREDAQDDAIQELTKMLFSDSPLLLMKRLLQGARLTEHQLLELRNLLIT
jgi:predicted transcriptional regulator